MDSTNTCPPQYTCKHVTDACITGKNSLLPDVQVVHCSPIELSELLLERMKAIECMPVVVECIPLAQEVKDPPRKKVRFAETGKVKRYEENRLDKKLQKEYLPQSSSEREVSEIQAKLNLWSDSEVDRDLYDTNTKFNNISPEVQDFKARDENLFNLVESRTINELKLQYWHKRGSKPLRNLLGMILCSYTPEKDLNSLQSNTINDLIRVTNKMMENLENGKKQTYCLYEVSAHLSKKNIPLLKKRLQLMENILESKK